LSPWDKRQFKFFNLSATDSHSEIVVLRNLVPVSEHLP
jgi:hypothetical protein